MTQKVYKLTRGRFQELEDELRYLRTTREREVAEQIKEARAFGDLSENSEYDEAKNEQGKLYSRIAEIENILAHAVLLDDGPLQTDTIEAGCKVLLKDRGAGRELSYYIVGSQEADPAKQRISDESPLGRALLGAGVGQEVSFEAPAGTMRFEVLEISR